ncbi:hypothetical protein Tco_1326911 [Tanacetum coccineum]
MVEPFTSPLAPRALIFSTPPNTPIEPHPYLSSTNNAPPRSTNPFPQSIVQDLPQTLQQNSPIEPTLPSHNLPNPSMERENIEQEIRNLQTFHQNVQEAIQNAQYVQDNLIPPTSITHVQLPPPFYPISTSTQTPLFGAPFPPPSIFGPLDQSLRLEQPPKPQDHTCPHCLRTESIINNFQTETRYVLWKPSPDFTHPLGPPSGLKGLFHTLNATVIPTKVTIQVMHMCGARMLIKLRGSIPNQTSWMLYRLMKKLLVMVDVARGSRLGALLRACCLFIIPSKSRLDIDPCVLAIFKGSFDPVSPFIRKTAELRISKHLEENHITWAQFGKKQDKNATLQDFDEALDLQCVETVSQSPLTLSKIQGDDVTTFCDYVKVANLKKPIEDSTG